MELWVKRHLPVKSIGARRYRGGRGTPCLECRFFLNLGGTADDFALSLNGLGAFFIAAAQRCKDPSAISIEVGQIFCVKTGRR